MKRSKIVETVTAAFLVASLVSVPGAAARLLSDADVCLQPFHQHRDVSAVDSLLVSELAVLRNAFTLKEVMTKLARDSREPGITAQDVWREWWDTQNFSPGLGMGIHCDDNGMIEGEGVLNGFPVQCPRAEGQEIALVPFLEDNPAGPHYELIALVNRFDMAPSDGRHCGEYRAIFARMQPSSSGGGGSDPAGEAGDDVGNSPPATGRNLVIFEAVVPNPMIALPSIATNPSSGAIDCSDFRTDFRSAPNICASYLATALIDLAVIGLILNAAAGSTAAKFRHS